MGAIADGVVAYAQPLLDQTDGSLEQLNKALSLAQLCFNTALLPEDGREKMLSEMRTSFQMDEAEFADFRRSMIDPMIQRHREMFPQMHQRHSASASSGVAPASSSGTSPWAQPRTKAGEGYPGTEPYAPCPCNSGKKYKFCCKKKTR